MQIRPEQLQVFEPVAKAAFARRVIDYVQDNYAGLIIQLPTGEFAVAQMADETLHQIVQNGIDRACGHGLSWESSLTAFVVLMFVVAPNFDEHPLFQLTLRDETVPPNARLGELMKRTTDKNWQAAKERYDASAWYPKTREHDS